MLLEARNVMETVDVPPTIVYEFARRPENLPQWASGLASGVESRDGRWICRSPMGEVEVVMAERNTFGVMDHEVKLPDGTHVHNAFRVTPSGTGSVLVFTVLRMPGTSPQAFDADVEFVQQDLKRLRELLEARERPA